MIKYPNEENTIIIKGEKIENLKIHVQKKEHNKHIDISNLKNLKAIRVISKKYIVSIVGIEHLKNIESVCISGLYVKLDIYKIRKIKFLSIDLITKNKNIMINTLKNYKNYNDSTYLPSSITNYCCNFEFIENLLYFRTFKKIIDRKDYKIKHLSSKIKILQIVGEKIKFQKLPHKLRILHTYNSVYIYNKKYLDKLKKLNKLRIKD